MDEKLLGEIHMTWEISRLPQQWKVAPFWFILKHGKAHTIENMRTISLSSCVGKVMERMVLRRLQTYLDETNQMPEKMYGFRPHLGTHDVLVQLQELVIKKATRNPLRGILAST